MIFGFNNERLKTADDISLNISHFLDHLMMLIFAKAAYDAVKYFELSYDEIILCGTLAFVYFGVYSSMLSYLAKNFLDHSSY